MKKWSKKGQGVFGMSYGVIFSIFIIIAIISVAFYAITYFLGLNECSRVGFFFQDLQEEVDKAWTSGKHKSTFVGEIPTSGILKTRIEQVCFGRLADGDGNGPNGELKEDVYYDWDSPDAPSHNVFMYPSKESCDGDFYFVEIEHVKVISEGGFFCTEVDDGKVRVKLSKETFEDIVSLSKV
jgi:hypothetical protein